MTPAQELQLAGLVRALDMVYGACTPSAPGAAVTAADVPPSPSDSGERSSAPEAGAELILFPDRYGHSVKVPDIDERYGWRVDGGER